MNLTAHDQAIIDGMEKDFEEMTGKKSTHVFLDTKETISDGLVMQKITNWEELSKIPDSKTHRLFIEEYSGWIISKETGDHDEYLSTHTFYGNNYKYSSELLQKYGFNVQLKNWDEHKA